MASSIFLGKFDMWLRWLRIELNLLRFWKSPFLMMLKNLILFASPPYDKNVNLLREDSPFNVDGLLEPGIRVSRALGARGWRVWAVDDALRENIQPDAVVLVESPRGRDIARLKKWGNVNRYLWLQESPLIRPENWDVSRHGGYKKIFTWCPLLLSMSDRYVKINVSNFNCDKIDELNFNSRPGRGLCIISGNKASLDRRELYSKRLEVVNWYEQNAPEDLSQFGTGWDRYELRAPRLIKGIFRLTPFLPRAMAVRRIVCKGRAISKASVLLSHQFNICFENAHGIPGYLTEKLFDSMLYGCIPVYWGAPEVSTNVPQECYIDYSHFGSPSALHGYLRSLSEAECDAYRSHIFEFIKSRKIFPYTLEYTVGQIVNAID